VPAVFLRLPEWLRRIVGNHFFDRVRCLWLYESAADADLAHLEDLPDVDWVLTDQGIVITTEEIAASKLAVV
jgi:hypothetical protein